MIAANGNSINYGFIVSFIDFVYKITMATQFFLTRFSCKRVYVFYSDDTGTCYLK